MRFYFDIQKKLHFYRKMIGWLFQSKEEGGEKYQPNGFHGSAYRTITFLGNYPPTNRKLPAVCHQYLHELHFWDLEWALDCWSKFYFSRSSKGKNHLVLNNRISVANCIHLFSPKIVPIEDRWFLLWYIAPSSKTFQQMDIVICIPHTTSA